MRGILEELFGPAVETPQYYLGHVWGKPIQPERVYPCVYTGKPEFDTIEFAGEKRCFVLIRDPRDTLISAYYSLRNTHEANDAGVAFVRRILTKLTLEEGLVYLMDTWLFQAARIQRTWLQSNADCYRLEDCMSDAPTVLRRMLGESWGVSVSDELVTEVALRHSFAKLSGGRAPGQEDLNSHYRKGVAGDWRSHFTPAVTQHFKELYNDLLVLGRYETSDDWSAKESARQAGALAQPQIYSCAK